VGGCCWWLCAIEAGDPLMSLAVSIWWLPLVCSEVANRRGSVDWCAGLLGGGSTAETGWDVADGRGAAVGKPDYSRGWWIVFFFCNQNSRCFFFWTMTIFF
jgi:hypothetical protein